MQLQRKMESVQAIEDMTLLKGSFLVSSPMLKDDRFKQTAVFICESSPNRTFGFIINPTEKNTTAKFKNKFKKTMLANVPVYSGGPVDEHRLFLLHSNDHVWPESLKIGNICITKINDVIKNITKEQKLPNDYIIISGFANWIQFQLEREITMGYWLLAQPNSNIIFDKKITN